MHCMENDPCPCLGCTSGGECLEPPGNEAIAVLEWWESLLVDLGGEG